MDKLRFHISGPDAEDKEGPWRLFIYIWKEAHKNILGWYEPHSGPFYFQDIQAVVAAIKNSQEAAEKES